MWLQLGHVYLFAWLSIWGLGKDARFLSGLFSLSYYGIQVSRAFRLANPQYVWQLSLRPTITGTHRGELQPGIVARSRPAEWLTFKWLELLIFTGDVSHRSQALHQRPARSHFDLPLPRHSLHLIESVHQSSKCWNVEKLFTKHTKVMFWGVSVGHAQQSDGATVCNYLDWAFWCRS